MPEVSASKYVVTAGWDDVPHLDEDTKRELLDSTLPHLRDARSKGIPSLGSGAIYPLQLDDILVDPFPIPIYWAKVYALDVGWNRTAALWLAYDRDNDVAYAYTEHYVGQALPTVHAAAIKARGDWIPGVIDPASRGRSQRDGEQLFRDYTQAGLKLIPAENSVESGIYDVWERLSTGRLKVFRTCQNWQREFKVYRRDENGHIIKKFDHLMDVTRYGVVSGLRIAITKPIPKPITGFTAGDAVAGY